jgi:WD40 repeat protein
MIVLQGARKQVDVLKFSPDGRVLVASCPVGVQIWSGLSQGGRPTAVLEHHRVQSVSFTPDGRKLLLGGPRLVVHDLLSAEAAEVPLELPSPYHSRTAMCELSPDGRFLIAAEVDPERDSPDRVFCHALADLGSCLWSIDVKRQVLSPPLFLASGERFVLFEGRPDSIPHWNVTRDAQTGRVLSEVAGSGHHFHSRVQSADRRWIAGRRGAWGVAVYRADDLGAEPMVFRNDPRKEFTGLAFHPSGRYLAATSNDGLVRFYDTTTWKVARSYDWDIGRQRSVAFSPDGMLAAVGGDKGKIVVWDVDL